MCVWGGGQTLWEALSSTELEPKGNVLELARQSCSFSVHKAVGIRTGSTLKVRVMGLVCGCQEQRECKKSL